MIQDLFNRLSGYRKVLITLIVFFTSVILLVLKLITPDNWVDLNKFVIPAFLAANIAEYFGSRGKDAADTKLGSDS